MRQIYPGRATQEDSRPGLQARWARLGRADGTAMGQDRRFGKRVTEPSSVQIVHELKLMALRQSLDAALESEAVGGKLTAEARTGDGAGVAAGAR